MGTLVHSMISSLDGYAEAAERQDRTRRRSADSGPGHREGPGFPISGSAWPFFRWAILGSNQ